MPSSLDALAHAVDFVDAEVVHDDDMAGTLFWDQHLVEVGEEDLAVGRGLDGHRGGHAGMVHRAQDSERLLVPAGHGLVEERFAPCPLGGM